MGEALLNASPSPKSKSQFYTWKVGLGPQPFCTLETEVRKHRTLDQGEGHLVLKLTYTPTALVPSWHLHLVAPLTSLTLLRPKISTWLKPVSKVSRTLPLLAACTALTDCGHYLGHFVLNPFENDRRYNQNVRKLDLRSHSVGEL